MIHSEVAADGFYPDKADTSKKAIMVEEVCHGETEKVLFGVQTGSRGFGQRSGVTKSQIARELGINASLLGRWSRELKERGRQAFGGQGKPRDEEMARLKRELVRDKAGGRSRSCAQIARNEAEVAKCTKLKREPQAVCCPPPDGDEV